MTQIIQEEESQKTAIVQMPSPLKVIVSPESQNNVVILEEKPVIVTAQKSSPIVKISQQSPQVIKARPKETVVQMGQTVNPKVSIGTQGLTGPKGDTGVIGAKGNKGDPGDFALDDFNKYQDISTQMDFTSGKTIFDVGEDFIHIRVLYNGRIQNHAIITTSGTTFTLDFVPKEGPNKKLEIFYDIP